MNVRYEKFDVGFVCKFDNKKYDFDRVVLFVSLMWLKSVDFTGVLSDFRVFENLYVRDDAPAAL